jgi:type II secretory pathway pseudopilin PulG
MSRRLRRAGFTLVEITMVMTLLAMVGALVMPFFLKQSRSVTNTAGNLDAQQSVSFALNMIDHDGRVAGIGTGLNQPMLVEANPLALTFNANLVTKDTAAVTTASYYDPAVADSLSTSLSPGNKITLPLAAVQYPDSSYYQTPGLVSPAQTISFYLRPDSSVVTVPATYLIWRRVNSATPVLLARGLVLPPGGAAFRYFIPGATPNSLQELIVGAGQLPLYFTEPQGPTNGPDTMIAKISEVRVQLSAMYQDQFGHQTFRSVNEAIPLLNAGLAHFAACGPPPSPVGSLTASRYGSGDSVDIQWTPSADETGGYKDVASYIIYRRTQPSTVWKAIYRIQADGVPTYDLHDLGLVGGGTRYDYAAAAQDCTPSLSTLVQQTGVKPKP